MAKCLNIDCKNEVISKEKSRPKKYCSDACRLKGFYSRKKTVDNLAKITNAAKNTTVLSELKSDKGKKTVAPLETKAYMSVAIRKKLGIK